MGVVARFRPPRPRAPGFEAIRSWRRHGRGDLVAGVAVAAYLIPQCLAYARLAGLQPAAGLWTALPALLVYSLLGSSRLLSVGPESASALLVGSAVATLSRSGEIEPAEAAAALALAVAVISLVAWWARLGFLADLLSKPVLVGYLAGVAFTMVVSQLPNITGIATTNDDTLPRLVDVLGRIGDLRSEPLLMSVGVLLALFALRRVRLVPGPLVVVLGATAVTVAFDLERDGIEVVRRVPGGLPEAVLPSIPAELWPGVFAAAAGIAAVAFSGNVLVGRAFAHRRGERIDADQELLALAGANAAAGLAGGFPVSSSDSRTALAALAGGVTQLTSLVAAGCVLVVLLVAAPVLEKFPLAALGALVVYAAVQLVDVRDIRRVLRFRRSEGLIMAVAFAGVVAFDLLIGIGVAVVLSLVELLRRVARGHDAVQGSVPGLAGLHDIDDYPDATTIPGLVVYRYDAPLFFANAEDFRTRVLAAVDTESHPVEWVVLNVEANVEVDLTALDVLEELRAELAARGIVLALARVKQDLAVYLDRTGLLDRISADHVFPTLPTALDGFNARTERRGGD